MSKKNKKKQKRRPGLDMETESRLAYLRGLSNNLMDRKTSMAIRNRLCELKLDGTIFSQAEGFDYLKSTGEFTQNEISLFHREEVESLTEMDLREDVRHRLIGGEDVEVVTQWALRQPHPLLTGNAKRREYLFRIRRLVAWENARIQNYEEVLTDIRRVAMYEDGATLEKVEQRVETARRKHLLMTGAEVGAQAKELNLLDAFFREDVADLDIDDAIDQALVYYQSEKTERGEETPEIKAIATTIRAFADSLLRRVYAEAEKLPDIFQTSTHPTLRNLRFHDPDVQSKLDRIYKELGLEERLHFIQHIHMLVGVAKKNTGSPIDVNALEYRFRDARTGSTWIIDAHGLDQRNPHGTSSDLTVETYTHAVANVYRLTRGLKSKKERDQSIHLWRMLQQARLFHFEPETYAGLHTEADRYTTEVLAGLDFQPGSTKKRLIAEAESNKLCDAVLRGSRDVPFPDKLPFPVVFFGYGLGMVIMPETLIVKAPPQIKDNIVKGGILGHLLSDTGHGFVFYTALLRDSEGLRSIFWVDSIRTVDGKAWISSDYNLEPWILPPLVNIINDHRTFLLETAVAGQQRAKYKNERKAMGLKPNSAAYTPAPFYRLKLTTKVIQEKVRKGYSRPRPPVTYRTDVRAHERCRIRRGVLPIDPETAADLTKRGYTIYTNNPLDADSLRRLYERGVPFKRSDEWLAIKVSWVKEHYTSNDPNLPYVPATRECGNVRIKPKNIDSSWRYDPASA